jgi:hypothetical protein
MSRAELRESIQRTGTRKSATELMGHYEPKRTLREKARAVVERARMAFRMARQRAQEVIKDRIRTRELDYAR